MSKAVRFHKEALIELAAEAECYESAVVGLGERFTNEIEAATWIAAEFPPDGLTVQVRHTSSLPQKVSILNWVPYLSRRDRHPCGRARRT